jgi:hypothetical protein
MVDDPPAAVNLTLAQAREIHSDPGSEQQGAAHRPDLPCPRQAAVRWPFKCVTNPS